MSLVPGGNFQYSTMEVSRPFTVILRKTHVFVAFPKSEFRRAEIFFFFFGRNSQIVRPVDKQINKWIVEIKMAKDEDARLATRGRRSSYEKGGGEEDTRRHDPAYRSRRIV